MATAVSVLFKIFVIFFALGLVQDSIQAPAASRDVCPIPMDIALLLDSSGSIGRRNWKKVLKFAKSVVDNYNISENGTHIAIMMYSSNPEIMIGFNKYTGANLNAAVIKREIENFSLQKGLTFIDKALVLAETDLFTEKSGMRKDVPKVAIVMTDGIQTKDRGPFMQLQSASSVLQAKNVTVYSLGVGMEVDALELLDIASSAETVFASKNFDDLSNIAKYIREAHCPEFAYRTIAPTTASQRSCPVMDIALILDSSGSVGRRGWKTMTTASSGFVSELNISDIGTHVAVMSFSSNPEVKLRFNTYAGRHLAAQNIKKDIKRMRLSRGLTFIDKALLLADKEVFTTQNGMRQGSKKVAILVTDGEQTKDCPFTPLDIAAKGLKDKGVDIFTLAIGVHCSKEELLQVASSNANYLHGKSFTNLSSMFSKVLEQQLC